MRERTLSAKKDWYSYLEMTRHYYRDYYSPYGADDVTVQRWMVNYIRHNLTQYDESIMDFARKTGKYQAYMVYLEGIFSKISETYPELATECQNQFDAKKSILQY